MKYFRIGLMGLICLCLASCSSTDYKALAEKAEKNPSSLTQKDYAEMIQYVNDHFDKVMNMDEKQLENMPEEASSTCSTFMGVLMGADFGMNDDLPKLDEANKEKMDALKKKMQSSVESMTPENY